MKTDSVIYFELREKNFINLMTWLQRIRIKNKSSNHRKECKKKKKKLDSGYIRGERTKYCREGKNSQLSWHPRYRLYMLNKSVRILDTWKWIWTISFLSRTFLWTECSEPYQASMLNLLCNKWQEKKNQRNIIDKIAYSCVTNSHSWTSN